ncbi:hypothetical protein AVEN_119073-1 [Araneus ventricosus]|uniref:Uncharacterized protein n=1 Tax=Araneus ventricosus TaxID=182803 RepID=A0A4Y2BL46_ARAVE|nr:hypothetical protein AVEN_119073-1 [Araneus ventricosus]
MDSTFSKVIDFPFDGAMLITKGSRAPSVYLYSVKDFQRWASTQRDSFPHKDSTFTEMIDFLFVGAVIASNTLPPNDVFSRITLNIESQLISEEDMALVFLRPRMVLLAREIMCFDVKTSFRSLQ